MSTSSKGLPPIGPPRGDEPEGPRIPPLVGWIAAGAALVALFVWVIGAPAWRHERNGREIDRIAAELLAELDSYGPLSPAEGHRSVAWSSDIWGADLDPSRHWTYFGEAIYSPEPSDSNHATPEEAYEAFRTYLTDHGWSGGGPITRPTDGYAYAKDGHYLAIHYNPDQDAERFRYRVAFRIVGPYAGGPLPA